MIELVELLGQFVAVVGNTTWTIVLASLLNSSCIVAHLLYEVDFLLTKFCRHISALDIKFCSLSHDRADAGVGILDKRTGIAVEVDRLLGVEQHILACINLEDEILKGTQSHDACNLAALLVGHIVKLAEFLACLLCVGNHSGNEVVGINNSTLAALHLTIRQFYHTIGEMHEFLAPLESKSVE